MPKKPLPQHNPTLMWLKMLRLYVKHTAPHVSPGFAKDARSAIFNIAKRHR